MKIWHIPALFMLVMAIGCFSQQLSDEQIEDEDTICVEHPDYSEYHSGFYPELVEYRATGSCPFNLDTIWIGSVGAITHSPGASICQRFRKNTLVFTSLGHLQYLTPEQLLTSARRPEFMNDGCNQILKHYTFRVGCHGACEHCPLNPIQFGKYAFHFDAVGPQHNQAPGMSGTLDISSGRYMNVIWETGHFCEYEATWKYNAEVYQEEFSVSRFQEPYMGVDMKLPTYSYTYEKDLYKQHLAERPCDSEQCCPHIPRMLSFD